MSFDLNILVNGHRCKQYYHQGKTFIEAKNGSEYVIEIKNNHSKRVLAVGSVDGLNVLTGKSASSNDTGYIVGAYSCERIKGFRFSDTEWAMFRFGYKFYGNTYAQSKEDGSEKNCGVIGMRIFYEKEPVVTYIPNPIIINNPPPYNPWPNWPYFTTTTTTTTPNYSLTGACGGYSAGGGRGLSAGSNASYTSNVNYTCNSLGSEKLMDYSSTLKDSSPTKGGSKKRSFGGGQSATARLCSADGQAVACAGVPYEQPEQDFDMGTEFGRREYSKIHNVEFERGCIAQSFDIYYASRESLINMGIPLVNTLQTNLPQSFPSQYCTPPKNWS